MEVSLHSWAKVPALKAYLSTFKHVFKNMNKKFFFYDLYAGDGICEASYPEGFSFRVKSREHIQWDGSAKVSLKYCNKMGKVFGGAVFNEPDRSNYLKLKKNLKNLIKNEELVKFYSRDANKFVDELLEIIPKDQHNFINLDPFNYKHLKWETIQKIGNHSNTDSYKNIEYTRRPDLMITFMTYPMTIKALWEKRRKNHPYYSRINNLKFHPITKALGTDEWIELFDKIEYRHRRYLIFKELFEKQLEKLYFDQLRGEKDSPKPYSIMVRSFQKNSPLYFIVFISSHPLANNIISELLPYIKRAKNEKMLEWVRLEFESSKNQIISKIVKDIQ